MWAYETIFYQIYPLGFCGCPAENDGVCVPRIKKVTGWLEHLEKLGIGGVIFNPVFQSDRHGYDTRDFLTVDCRLGSNEGFAQVCDALHRRGMRVVLDGVFNHVGRGFWAFQDVLARREESPYRDWFFLNFQGNSNYNDGLWYEGWEGHFELVKLNLRNPQVREYLFSCVDRWVEEFRIDGLRLDVAYCLEEDFLRALRQHCEGRKEDFFLYGEILGGDYRRLLGEDKLHSCTNYECWKGLWSSFNDYNLFEIAHSLGRLFSDDPYALCRGSHLLSFADNHDVTRLASNLREKAHLPLCYALLFAMPGIPCLYYGSEWGAEGEKSWGDQALRPCFDAPVENELTALLGRLARARTESKALCYGGFARLDLTNRQLAFLREWEGERVVFALNLEGEPRQIGLGQAWGEATDLLTGEKCTLSPRETLPPLSARLWRLS